MNDCHLKEMLKFLFKAPWVEFGKFCKNVVSQGQNELPLNAILPLLEIVKQNLDQLLLLIEIQLIVIIDGFSICKSAYSVKTI